MNVNPQVVLTLDPAEFETILNAIHFVVNDNARITKEVYGQAVAMAIKLGIQVDSEEDDFEDEDEEEIEEQKLH